MGKVKNTYGVSMREETKVKDKKTVITPAQGTWAGKDKKSESK